MTRERDGHIYRDVFYIVNENQSVEQFSSEIAKAVSCFLNNVEHQAKCEIGHEEILFDRVKLETSRDMENGHLDVTLWCETRSVPAKYGELLKAYSHFGETH